MRETLVACLACPDCGRDLHLVSVARQFHLAGARHVVDGVLGCGEGHRFPIVDEVARLVPERLLTDAELAALAERAPPAPLDVRADVVPSAEVESDIRRQIEADYGITADATPGRRRRAAAEIEYLVAEHRGDNKQKYARLVAGLGVEPRSILDVGGSLPGMVGVLAKGRTLDRAVVVDYSPRHALAFRTAERSITLVRGDAQRLPFRAGSFDLVVSAFLLEHVPDWRTAVRAIVHVGSEALVAFGPNRWFPYELGHFDAPLAGTLPAWLAAYPAYAWLRFRGRPRSMAGVRALLSEMTYVSSRQFRRECEAIGLRAKNLFPELVRLVATDRDAPETPVRQALRRWPGPACLVARLLAATGTEPQMYYHLRPGRRLGLETGQFDTGSTPPGMGVLPHPGGTAPGPGVVPG